MTLDQISWKPIKSPTKLLRRDTLLSSFTRW